ncbi:uncharacterized protein LOC135693743 [Rhopilema esculentum]|uniref:uncharacterized protein LOC135693743 n=1 Tax=Rhopilema esculentum TaxID=499914 RepID=UPI0031DC44CC
MNLSTSKVSPQDPMMFQSMESYSVKCLGCLEDIPIDQLREHHKKCISSNNQEVHGASTKKEFYQAIVDTQVQIVLDESQWDRSTPIQLENKLTLIQWLLQYDVLIKREKAIKHFGKGLATLGLVRHMQKFPEYLALLGNLWEQNSRNKNLITIMQVICWYWTIPVCAIVFLLQIKYISSSSSSLACHTTAGGWPPHLSPLITVLGTLGSRAACLPACLKVYIIFSYMLIVLLLKIIY